MGLFGFGKKDPHKELKGMLNGFELPTFSTVVMQFLKLLRDSESSMQEIAAAVNRDPSLIVAIFQRVNSAAVGVSRRVDNINQAVALLGRAKVEALVLSYAVKQSLPQVRYPWFSIDEFWKLSAKRAVLAGYLAKKLHPTTVTQSFTGGMLQDMGIPVLASVKGEDYEHIYLRSESAERIVTMEQKNFTFDHQRVGMLMSQEWNLPSYLTETISNHHTLEAEPAIRLVATLTRGKEEEGLENIVLQTAEEFHMDAGLMRNVIEQALEEADSVF